MRVVLFYLVSLVIGAILGIDYGQQFTKSVLLAPNIKFEMVLTDEGKRKDLSGICIKQDGEDVERIFGSHMSNLITRFPSQSILDLKLLLGKSIDDIDHYLKSHFIKLSNNSRNSIDVDLGLSNYTFSVEELFAMYLNDIKKRAIKDLKNQKTAQVLDTVISIPPFASQATRQAYLDSLSLANLKVLGLVDEGTAVALNFASKKEVEEGYHLIYDVGAGYTTATLFSIGQNLTIESIGYDEKFGGRFLTESIYSKFIQDFPENDKIKARIWELSEKAKIILSANSEFKSSLEIDDKEYKFHITRDEFEELNSDLMENIVKPIENALRDANVNAEDVNSVILNGGSTRVPFIQKHVASLMKLSKSVNTDESCALGTTLQGLKLKTGSEIIERNFHNYEYKIDDEIIVLFPKGSTNKTASVNFTSDSISLLQDGELIKTYKFNKGKYTGVFTIDDNKIFDVKINTTTKTIYPHVQPIINKKELIDKLSWLNKQDDLKIELTELQNQLESRIYYFRNYIEDNEVLLSEETDLTPYQVLIEELMDWLDENDDLEETKNKIKQISESELELKKFIHMKNTDLSLEGMKKLYQDSSNLMIKIQSSMLEFGNKISEIRKKYEDSGLNFDKENDKLKLKSEDRLLTFDKNLKNYKDIVTQVGKLIESDDFDNYSKVELYKFHDDLAKGIAEMFVDIISIESSHHQRVQHFEDQFVKLLEREKKKEYRRILREAEKEKKKKEQEEKEKEEKEVEVDEKIEEQVTEETSEIDFDNQTKEEVSEETETEQNLEHDEL
ncbi:unnamed protein product [Candida verbasci]|uniref:Uncharacterized protein n=1 Tax=Candida verbasci TaxID=1227364 RepID=A0A9W4TS40_9ASCO|nr:unnamed protein product [Candida verbasci]